MPIRRPCMSTKATTTVSISPALAAVFKASNDILPAMAVVIPLQRVGSHAAMLARAWVVVEGRTGPKTDRGWSADGAGMDRGRTGRGLEVMGTVTDCRRRRNATRSLWPSLSDLSSCKHGVDTSHLVALLLALLGRFNFSSRFEGSGTAGHGGFPQGYWMWQGPPHDRIFGIQAPLLRIKRGRRVPDAGWGRGRASVAGSASPTVPTDL